MSMDDVMSPDKSRLISVLNLWVVGEIVEADQEVLDGLIRVLSWALNQVG